MHPVVVASVQHESRPSRNETCLMKFYLLIAAVMFGMNAPIAFAQVVGGHLSWQPNADLVEKLSERRPQFNYDEAKVPTYQLPAALQTNQGDTVTDADMWVKTRRGEVLELFRKHVYGRRPATEFTTSFEVTQQKSVLDGDAIGQRIDVTISIDDRSFSFPMVCFTPTKTERPAAAVVLINNRYFTPVDDITTTYDSFFPVKDLIDRGYASISFFTSDVDPDRSAGYDEGIRAFFASGAQPADDAWRSLSAWGFAASRALDYLQTLDSVDASRVAVVGHSRGGKAALWAAAEDQRFAIAYSNQSGCGGAALSRRAYGETVSRITESFPHWFVPAFSVPVGNENDLPVDQHQLIALIAPRSVYVASADEDLWADPKGEFLSLVHAAPVYDLFDLKTIGHETLDDKSLMPFVSPPPLDQPLIVGPTGYHVGRGPHGLTHVDWGRFLNFADRRFQ